MKKHVSYPAYYDFYEYHGNTQILRIRKQGKKTLRKDWLSFNTVEEAMDYFNSGCRLCREFH